MNDLLLKINIISMLLFPSNAIYTKVNTNLGNLIIYFNSQISNKLIYDAEKRLYINCYSSTVYGYVNYNGNDYTVIFPTYDTPYIRINNQYQYFEYMDVLENNGLITFNKINDSVYLAPVMILLLLFGYLGISLTRK